MKKISIYTIVLLLSISLAFIQIARAYWIDEIIQSDENLIVDHKVVMNNKLFITVTTENGTIQMVYDPVTGLTKSSDNLVNLEESPYYGKMEILKKWRGK